MSRDRLLFAATFLSGAASLLAILMGLGTGLAESDGAWAFFILGLLAGAAAILCDKARD